MIFIITSLFIFNSLARADGCLSALLTEASPKVVISYLVEQQAIKLRMKGLLAQAMKSASSTDEVLEKYDMIEASQELLDVISDAEIINLLQERFEKRAKLLKERSDLSALEVSFFSAQKMSEGFEVLSAAQKRIMVEQKIRAINLEIEQIEYAIATMPAPDMGSAMNEIIRREAQKQ